MSMQTAFLESVQEKEFTGCENKVQGRGGRSRRRLFSEIVFDDKERGEGVAGGGGGDRTPEWWAAAIISVFKYLWISSVIFLFAPRAGWYPPS